MYTFFSVYFYLFKQIIFFRKIISELKKFLLSLLCLVSIYSFGILNSYAEFSNQNDNLISNDAVHIGLQFLLKFSFSAAVDFIYPVNSRKSRLLRYGVLKKLDKTIHNLHFSELIMCLFGFTTHLNKCVHEPRPIYILITESIFQDI